MDHNKKIPLRVAYIIPILLLGAYNIFFIYFVGVNYEALRRMPPAFLGHWIPHYAEALPPFSTAHLYLIVISLITIVFIVCLLRFKMCIREGKL